MATFSRPGIPDCWIQRNTPEIRCRSLLLLYCFGLILQGLVFFRNPFAADLRLAPILAAEITFAGPAFLLAAGREHLRWSALYIAALGAIFGGAYFGIHDWAVWGNDIITSYLVLSDSLSVIAVGVGASMLALVLQSRPRVRKTAEVSLAPLWGTWWFWVGSYIAATSLDAFAHSANLGFLVVIAQQWPLYAIIALDLLSRAGRAPRGVSRLVWWVLAPARVLLSFGTGFGMFVIRDVIVLLFYLSMRQIVRVRMYGIVCFAAFAFLVFAGRSYIRQTIWQEIAGPETRLDVAVTALKGLRNYSADDFVDLADSLVGDRIGHYGLVAHTVVVRDTPDSIPYLYGESLYQFVWTFVPRALFPDKPIENWGQKFGHRYGLLAPADDYTSFNMPEVTEAYANGGIWLVLILMFGIGWLIGRVGWWTGHLGRNSDDVLWLILPVSFGYLSDCQSNFSLSINAALYSAILLAFPTFLLRYHRRYFAPQHLSPDASFEPWSSATTVRESLQSGTQS